MSDEAKLRTDMMLHGVVFLKDGKHVPLSEIYLSSPDEKANDRRE